MNKWISQVVVIACCGLATFSIGRADIRMVPISIDDDLNIIIPIDVGAAIAGITLADAGLNTCLKTAATANGWRNAADVTSLSCVSVGITNLTGIEQFTHLRSLNLAGNALTSLASLAGLNQLTDLDVSGTGQGLNSASIAQLMNLSSLTSLTVTNNSSYPLTASAFSAGFAALKKLTIYTVDELDAGLSATIDTRFSSTVQLNVVTAAVPGATAVGNTPGSFSVTPSGAATYTIPIAIQPGAAGMQPSLSLAYSSQGGNGLVGMGFSLQGLSGITRCPQTYATEGNSGGVSGGSNDRYCLDGQKLIAINTGLAYTAAGQEYRTEVDSFAKVTAYYVAGTADPSYFIVKTKSGQTIQYGATLDARILIATTGTAAKIWAMNKVSDTVGNYLTISYCQYGGGSYCPTNPVGNPSPGVGEFYPTRIDYAGNVGTPTSSSVQFAYATRTDTFTGYLGGSPSTNSVRLINIKTYEGSSLIRDYRLSYDNTSTTARSRLSKLTECDGSSKCLPATSFNWSPGGVVGFGATATNTAITSDAQNTQIIDVNGDGKSDLVYCTSGTSTWRIAFSNGAGFNTPADTLIPCGNYQYAHPIDYNSDGKMDLIIQGSLGGSYTTADWYVLQSTGSSFSVVDTHVSASGYQLSPPLVMDLDGDGRADVMQWKMQDNNNASICGGGPLFQWFAFMNSSTGLGATSLPVQYNCSGNSTQQTTDYSGQGKSQMLLVGIYPSFTNATNWALEQFSGNAIIIDYYQLA